MSKPIHIGDQVIGIADGWNGTIGVVNNIDPDWDDIATITIVHSPRAGWYVGREERVLLECFARYIP